MSEVKPTYSMSDAISFTQSLAFHHNVMAASHRIDQLTADCHAIACSRGWWTDPNTGETTNRNFGELLALMHSELSEALEGDRKNLPSDHIQPFSMVEEEFADALIRIFDCARAMGLRLGDAFVAKCRYNLTRPDHSLEARKAGGKAY